MFHNHVTIQANAYQNGCWVIASAKAGREDGMPVAAAEVVEAGGALLRKRVLAQAQAPVEHRLELRRIPRIGAGHREVAGVVLVLRRRVGHQDAVDVVDRQRSGVYPVWGRNCGGLRPGVSAAGGFNPERSPMRPQPWCHAASNMALASARTGSRGSARRAAWFGAINTVRQAVTSGPGVARITLKRLRSA